MIGNLQVWIFLLLALALFVLEAWALIDAARRPAAAYISAGKRTKNFWVALTAAAAAIGFISIPPPLGLGILGGGFLQFAAVVPAAVYLADVRPAVRGYGGGRRRPPRAGGGW